MRCGADCQRRRFAFIPLTMSKTMIWWGGQYPDLEAMTRGGAGSMNGWLGVEFIEAGDDWIRARMPLNERSRQPFGRLHGGASVAFAETVGSVAAGACVDRTKFVGVGMEINANHIRPAYDGYVYALAKAESLGRTTQVWTIRIEDEAGKLVCLSRFTVAVIPLERK